MHVCRLGKSSALAEEQSLTEVTFLEMGSLFLHKAHMSHR